MSITIEPHRSSRAYRWQSGHLTMVVLLMAIAKSTHSVLMTIGLKTNTICFRHRRWISQNLWPIFWHADANFMTSCKTKQKTISNTIWINNHQESRDKQVCSTERDASACVSSKQIREHFNEHNGNHLAFDECAILNPVFSVFYATVDMKVSARGGCGY